MKVVVAVEVAERSLLLAELGTMVAVDRVVDLQSAEVPGNCCTSCKDRGDLLWRRLDGSIEEGINGWRW